jgi:hypothetical protein
MYRLELLTALELARETLVACGVQRGKGTAEELRAQLAAALARPPIAPDSVAVPDLLVALGYVCIDSEAWEVVLDAHDLAVEATQELAGKLTKRHRLAALTDVAMFFSAGHHMLWLADQARQERVPARRLPAFWGGVVKDLQRYRVSISRATTA